MYSTRVFVHASSLLTTRESRTRSSTTVASKLACQCESLVNRGVQLGAEVPCVYKFSEGKVNVDKMKDLLVGSGRYSQCPLCIL